MHDDLPNKIRLTECGIINLDKSAGMGTHWVAYDKTDNVVKYFDPVGNLQPTQRMVKYFKSSRNVKIMYNYTRYQFKDYNCGQLCLDFLNNNKNNI